MRKSSPDAGAGGGEVREEGFDGNSGFVERGIWVLSVLRVLRTVCQGQDAAHGSRADGETPLFHHASITRGAVSDPVPCASFHQQRRVLARDRAVIKSAHRTHKGPMPSREPNACGARV